MRDDELADVLEAFVKEARARQPKLQPPPTRETLAASNHRHGREPPAAKATSSRPASRKRKLR
jgi:hypothetical protein